MTPTTRDTSMIFKERMQKAYSKAEHGSMRALSLRAGMSESAVQQILSGKFDNSRTGPGIFAVKRLADAMGLSVAHLVGEDATLTPVRQDILNGSSDDGDLIGAFTKAHWRGGGRLEAFDHLIENCDQYAVPKDDANKPVIMRLGRNTLFSMRLGGTNIRDAQREINSMEKPVTDEVLAFHRKVAAEEISIKNTFLSHLMTTRAAHVRASVVRLGFHVVDMQMNPSILIHASPIPV